jgi:hypothetical protein
MTLQEMIHEAKKSALSASEECGYARGAGMVFENKVGEIQVNCQLKQGRKNPIANQYAVVFKLNGKRISRKNLEELI